MWTGGPGGRLGKLPLLPQVLSRASLLGRGSSSPGSGSVVATELVAEPPWRGNGGPGRCPGPDLPRLGPSHPAWSPCVTWPLGSRLPLSPPVPDSAGDPNTSGTYEFQVSLTPSPRLLPSE